MSKLCGTSKASRFWKRSHPRALQATVGPRVECFQEAVSRGPCCNHVPKAVSKLMAESSSDEVAITGPGMNQEQTHDMLKSTQRMHRGLSNLHKSNKNPSMTHRSSCCAVSRARRVDRHLSVLPQSTLSRTSWDKSLKQVRAQV